MTAVMYNVIIYVVFNGVLGRRNVCTPCHKKNCASVIFLNNSVKHWPTLIIFGMQHREET